MYIMFNVESVALKKSKCLCFASKEKLLKSDGVKSNDENMILMEVRMKVGVFWVILWIKIFQVKDSSVA